jgi:hypothetical protein
MSSLNSGAGEESRTLDLNLGKVALYQLSYSRLGVLLSTLCGAGEESRTLDLNLGKVALYQLSYSRTECCTTSFTTAAPDNWSGRRVSNSRPQPWQGCALPTELLPHTGDALSQKLFQFPRQAAATDFTANWSGRRVSNSRPQPWQGCALPTELLPLCVLLCPSFAAMSSQQASIIDDLIRTSRMTKN